MLSVVIPTLNAETSLPRTLAAVARGADEVVVADGGSTDGTRTLAKDAGARVVGAPRGRGPQLAAGGAAARGDWLLFLHADTIPGPGWQEAVAQHRADASDRAGAFRLRFDDPAPQARRLERLVEWRTRVLGLPYGDQGLLMARRLYEEIGGFRPLVLMEDVDMARRLGKTRITLLEADAVTSAERYRRGGWTARSARNLFCLSLFFLGLPPKIIKRIYR